jgi:hypothetical protein
VAQVALEVETATSYLLRADHDPLGHQRTGAGTCPTAATLFGIYDTRPGGFVKVDGGLVPESGASVVAGGPVALLTDHDGRRAGDEIIEVDANSGEVRVAFTFVVEGASDFALTTRQAATGVRHDDTGAGYLEELSLRDLGHAGSLPVMSHMSHSR